MTKQVKKLLMWIKENAESESTFLSPGAPNWNVNAHSLIKEVVNIFKLDEKEVEEFIDGSN